MADDCANELKVVTYICRKNENIATPQILHILEDGNVLPFTTTNKAFNQNTEKTIHSSKSPFLERGISVYNEMKTDIEIYTNHRNLQTKEAHIRQKVQTDSLLPRHISNSKSENKYVGDRGDQVPSTNEPAVLIGTVISKPIPIYPCWTTIPSPYNFWNYSGYTHNMWFQYNRQMRNVYGVSHCPQGNCNSDCGYMNTHPGYTFGYQNQPNYSYFQGVSRPVFENPPPILRLTHPFQSPYVPEPDHNTGYCSESESMLHTDNVNSRGLQVEPLDLSVNCDSKWVSHASKPRQYFSSGSTNTNNSQGLENKVYGNESTSTKQVLGSTDDKCQLKISPSHLGKSWKRVRLHGSPEPCFIWDQLGEHANTCKHATDLKVGLR